MLFENKKHMKEQAKPIDLPTEFRWNGGAPFPAVFSSEQATYLLAHSMVQGACVVFRFEECLAQKTDSLNEDGFVAYAIEQKNNAHSLALHIVNNSRWLAELRFVHGAYSRLDKSSRSIDIYSKSNHYILSFKDSIFECVAQAVYAAEMAIAYKDALLLVAKNMGNENDKTGWAEFVEIDM